MCYVCVEHEARFTVTRFQLPVECEAPEVRTDPTVEELVEFTDRGTPPMTDQEFQSVRASFMREALQESMAAQAGPSWEYRQERLQERLETSTRYVIRDETHLFTQEELSRRVDQFTRFYGQGYGDFLTGRNEPEEEPGQNYRPHGEITTHPAEVTAWVNPHHWASTLERSPYWHWDDEVLKVPGGDFTMTYRRDELDLDIRYV